MRYIGMLLVVVGTLASRMPAYAAEDRFAEPAFKEVWSRTDAAVAGGRADRSWLWGPQPFTGGLREPCAQTEAQISY